jgi:hypothetical protein
MKTILTCVLFLIFSIRVSACSDFKWQQKRDTTKAIKISEYLIYTKSDFKFSTLIKDSNDTLDIVSCSDFVFYPFGLITDKNDLKSSILKSFYIIDTIEQSDTEVQILKYNTSKILFYFDHDPEASTSSYIWKGQVYDKEIKFSNNMSIGISKSDFFNLFFDTFPSELMSRFDVIIIETCVTGIHQVYNFKNDKLISVRFDCIGCNEEIDF